MPLPDDVRTLADQVLRRLGESRDFYLHTREAWRIVLRVVPEGRGVGIADATTGRELPISDLEPLAQRYVRVHLARSVFRDIASLLEDWVLGLARLWLTAYPVQLDAAANDVAGRSRAQRGEIQVPLSEILAAPDREAILAGLAERVVRELAYRRPDQWFRFLDDRVRLGSPDEAQRRAVGEMKAARDALEHNRGIAGADDVAKAGSAARFAVGDYIEVDEPYLIGCFTLLEDVVGAMTAAAVRRVGPNLGVRTPRRRPRARCRSGRPSARQAGAASRT